MVLHICGAGDFVAKAAVAGLTGAACFWWFRVRCNESRARQCSAKLGGSLTVEDVGRFPKAAGLGSGSAPTNVEFAPGDKALTFLASPPGQLSRTLQRLDLETDRVDEVLKGAADESSYSAEEKMRRERMRLLHTGVTEYEWAGQQAEHLLIPLGGRDIYLLPRLGASAFPLFDADAAGLPTGQPVLDAKLSKDGAICGFVCANEVYTCRVGTSTAHEVTQVTSGARGEELSHGMADFLAQACSSPAETGPHAPPPRAELASCPQMDTERPHPPHPSSPGGDGSL